MSRVPELGRDGAVIRSLNTVTNKADKVPAVRECRAWDCNGEGGCRGSWPECEEGLAAVPDGSEGFAVGSRVGNVPHGLCHHLSCPGPLSPISCLILCPGMTQPIKVEASIRTLACRW